MLRKSELILIMVSAVSLMPSRKLVAENQCKIQGYSIIVNIGNNGAICGPPVQYPPGDPAGHIVGYGPWVGGLLDTSASGTLPPLKLVTTGYEGWAGPLYEFHPGDLPADTIWEASVSDTSEPPGWSDYWGADLAFSPFSDRDFYCRYDDFGVPITGSIPLNLTVVQSSFVWTSSEEDGILIIEYRIFNEGTRTIESAYVGFLCDKFERARWRYIQTEFLSYLEYEDPAVTPVGIAILDCSVPLESLDKTFQWYEGSGSPSPDSARYNVMSSGIAGDDESEFGNDTRSLTAIGPLTIPPRSEGSNPVIFAVALLSAPDIPGLIDNASEARNIYLNRGTLEAQGNPSSIPQGFALEQNYPNPFNPSTTIVYALPGSAQVRLEVFNVLGERVRILMDGLRDAGYHRVRFDGDGLPSGIYFYRLQATSANGLRLDSSGGHAGDFVKTKKFLLLK